LLTRKHGLRRKHRRKALFEDQRNQLFALRINNGKKRMNNARGDIKRRNRLTIDISNFTNYQEN
jgi:hypothetical protein